MGSVQDFRQTSQSSRVLNEGVCTLIKFDRDLAWLQVHMVRLLSSVRSGQLTKRNLQLEVLCLG